jgi:hypothetical protein
MNDLARILSDGDKIVGEWKNDNKEALRQRVDHFRQEYWILRGRLVQLINANDQFSDLKVVQPNVMDKLYEFLSNLLDAIGQTPNGIAKSDWEDTISPYIGPVTREIASLRQWLRATKNVANSSELDLAARQRSRQ